MTLQRDCSFHALYRQFVLSQNVIEVPRSWHVQQCGGWLLHHHEALPVIKLVDNAGRARGWILGWPILAHSLSETELRFDDGTWGEVEGHLYQLGGCWLGVLFQQDSQRVYHDPAGSMSCVFALDRRLVASSTTALVAGGTPQLKDDDLAHVLNIRETRLWYPFGLTALRNARRLLPNHYLDLRSWAVTRHWPQTASLQIKPRENAVADVLESGNAPSARSKGSCGRSKCFVRSSSAADIRACVLHHPLLHTLRRQPTIPPSQQNAANDA
jgi:hypothetical protein